MKAGVPLARIVRTATLWALITGAFCAGVIALAHKSHAQAIRNLHIAYSGPDAAHTGPLVLTHDGYSKWMQPPKPTVSCCSKQDCSPVEARFDERRKVYQALIEGEWRDIPPEIILDPKKPENTNPDGSYHACWNRATGQLLCFREAEPKI